MYILWINEKSVGEFTSLSEAISKLMHMVLNGDFDSSWDSWKIYQDCNDGTSVLVAQAVN